jgi:broad specificity phosphatase PhoE
VIWLVRHGQSELNAVGVRHRREETPLTALGLAQAHAVDIPTLNAFQVLTSPLLRAHATAGIIARKHKVAAPVVVDVLAERDWDQDCDVAAKPALDLLNAIPADQHTVIVTHAGIIKGLLGTDVTPANGAVIPWP